MAMRQFVVFALRGSGRASNSIQGSCPAVANVRFQSDTTSQQQMNYGGRTETSQGGNHQTSDMSNTASSQNNPPSGRATTGYTGSAYGPGSGSEANATEPSQGVSKDSSAESTSNRDPRDISGGEGTSRGRSAAPGGSTGSDSNTSTRSSQSSGQQHSSNYESSNSDRRAGSGSSYMSGSSTSSGGPPGGGSGSGGYGTTASTIGKVTRGASESSSSDTTAFPNSDKSTAESGTSYEEQDQGTGSKMKELSSRHYSAESGRVSKFANDDESLNQKNEQKEESRQRNSSRSSNDQQRRGSNENKDKW